MTLAPDRSASTERSKFELLKAGSGHLREPLATELENELPFFTEQAVQILKFHGSYRRTTGITARRARRKTGE